MVQASKNLGKIKNFRRINWHQKQKPEDIFRFFLSLYNLFNSMHYRCFLLPKPSIRKDLQPDWFGY